MHYNDFLRIQVIRLVPLPSGSFEPLPLFTILGCDFAGPLFVKVNANKGYVLLLNCAVTNVHLDSISTQVFLLAFRMLIARGGYAPQFIPTIHRHLNVLN